MFRASFVSSLRPLTNPLVFQAARHPQGVAFRSFSNARPNVLAAVQKRATLPSASFVRQSRSFLTDSAPVVTRPTQQEAWKRYGITAATVAGTIVAVNVFFNRETRDGLSPAEQSYLHESFMYAGGGLAVTAVAARSLFRSGFAFRLMATNPWVVLGVSLVGSIGTMMGTIYTSPENKVLKHAFWLGFNACQAATLSPLFFLSPAILSRAALYTAGVFGALSYVGATATNDKYLYMGGPLLAGVTVVALSSLAPMALPLGMRGLAISEAISLYGGLAVFSGFILFDTQKILQHARVAETGAMARDPMREAISLELDLINIFIRIVQILTMQQKKK
ncbi:Bax inhibitor family protein [Rhodofomes roseus]|uniref:Bax inhibitor family protein n=1 Tax=Rhodofomes roseus TaxID=34475 RepID=A0ABQ8KE21_9APHY|nr:Bax inhibitor family protein [Rhodofomes roseus]KAH9835895.1 Bax inhibitor family protein [Rhodofomes roseus]